MVAKKLEGERLGIPATMSMVRDIQDHTVLIQACANMQAPVDKRMGKQRVPNSSLCLSCNAWFLIRPPPVGNGGRCSKCRWSVCDFHCENVSLRTTDLLYNNILNLNES